MADIASLGDLRGKRVLVRSDLNVPLDGLTITDDGRIKASLPTIQALRQAGARVVVMAHLGRPKGAPDPAFSLKPVASRLGELLGIDVAFARDTVGDSARTVVAGLDDGQVALLENVRFNAGETSKDDQERGSSRTNWPSWVMPSSAMASASCIASKPVCMTLPPGCQVRWVNSSQRRSAYSNS